MTTRAVARNLSLLLMLAAFPLISVGTTRGRPLMWWIGLAALGIGSLIPPAMRFMPAAPAQPDDAARSDAERKPAEEHHHHATDLGDSCRVC